MCHITGFIGLAAFASCFAVFLPFLLKLTHCIYGIGLFNPSVLISLINKHCKYLFALLNANMKTELFTITLSTIL